MLRVSPVLGELELRTATSNPFVAPVVETLELDLLQERVDDAQDAVVAEVCEIQTQVKKKNPL